MLRKCGNVPGKRKLPNTRLLFHCDTLEPRLLLAGDLPESALISISRNAGSVVNSDGGSLDFNDEDILRYSIVDDSWSMYLDGSDVGLGTNDINAFHVLDDGDVLISLKSPMNLELADGTSTRVNSRDVLRFSPETLGSETSGTFTVMLRGNDNGLNVGGENIDALSMNDNGQLLISTAGNFDVGGVRGHDEDLFAIDPTTGTAGFWFDGSAAALTTAAEDIGAVAFSNGRTDVATRGRFRTSTSGANEPIVGRNGHVLRLDTNLVQATGIAWQADVAGLARRYKIDGIDFVDSPSTTTTIEQDLVVAARPLVVESADAYSVTPIYGSSRLPQGDLGIFAEMTTTGIGGIAIREDGSLNELLLIRSGGNWTLLSQTAGNFETLMTFENAGSGGTFDVQFTNNFTSVAVTGPDGETLTHEFASRFFAADDTIRIHSFAGPDSQIAITSLSTTQTIQEPESGPDTAGSLVPSLSDAAATQGILFGGHTDTWVGSPQHDLLMATHTELFTWSIDYPEDFTDPAASYILQDSQLSYAVAQDWRIRAHRLISHQTPQAFEGQTFTRDEMIANMRAVIQNTILAYPEVNEWVVVNEAVNYDGSLRESIWQQSIGDDYLSLAYEFAREVADADDVLILNEYEVDVPGLVKADAFYQLLTNLLAEGVPIDAVGLQTHIGLADAQIPTYDEALTNFQRFDSLGVEVHVTELDVNTFYLDGTAAEKEAQQAAIYGDIVQACVDSTVCDSILIWGFSDPFSWLFDPVQNQGGGESPLPFDANLAPKEAYWAILNAFEGNA